MSNYAIKTCLIFCFCLAFAFLPVLSQEPIQLSTETEDISLTDDLNVARAQVGKYPENPEAHFNLAIALTRTSLIEEAIKELRRTKLLLRKDENKDLVDKKIKEYKEIISAASDPVLVNNVRYRLAFCHYLNAYLLSKKLKKKEEDKSSKKNLLEEQQLTLTNKDPAIKENLDSSVNNFKELLSINPNDVWAKIYYGFILAEQFDETNKATELWIEASKTDPNNPAPHFFLGELHIKDGNLKDGLKEISQAILLRSLGY